MQFIFPISGVQTSRGHNLWTVCPIDELFEVLEISQSALSPRKSYAFTPTFQGILNPLKSSKLILNLSSHPPKTKNLISSKLAMILQRKFTGMVI